MRYATWNLLFTNNLVEGATIPVEFNGAFYSNEEQTQVAGYIPDNLNVSDFTNWSLTEITEQEFLNLLLSKNPKGELRNGKAWTPMPTEN